MLTTPLAEVHANTDDWWLSCASAALTAHYEGATA